MCYIIAKRFKQSGCIALQARRGKELAEFASNLQEELDDDIQIVAITRPYVVKIESLYACQGSFRRKE